MHSSHGESRSPDINSILVCSANSQAKHNEDNSRSKWKDASYPLHPLRPRSSGTMEQAVSLGTRDWQDEDPRTDSVSLQPPWLQIWSRPWVSREHLLYKPSCYSHSSHPIRRENLLVPPRGMTCSNQEWLSLFLIAQVVLPGDGCSVGQRKISIPILVCIRKSVF